NKLTIAYFGGSLTENGEEKGWRRLTTKWFEARYPEAKITEVNAAIGGTGTDLGVYRCDRDVIAHKPDLTFIEFAVNDSGSAPDALSRTTEAIVRKLLSSNPTMEIVFVFTITKAINDRLHDGIPYRSRDIHSAIAAHYSLPTIDIGTPLAEAAAKAEKGWLEYTNDTVHPIAAGYVIKEKALLNGLEPLLTADAPDTLVTYPIPAPLYSDLPINARLIDAYELAQLSDPSVDWGKAQPDTTLERGWSKLFFHLCGRWPTAIGANKPGSEFTISFQGTSLGIYWMMASDSGDIDFRIDNGAWQHKSSFDEYCPRFARANFHMLAQNLPEGTHTVTLRVSESKDARSTGRWVRIGAFGIS
ncbi:MAG: hypothetical protein IJC25_03135, partial [Clostridia bacterium]|nr:hypothetical protein [Clostridia bacterium]